MTAIPVIAIFDIGKTNKKFFLLDEAYRIVLERSAPFEETTDEDGDPCDDIALISAWVKETLESVLQLKKFEIRAVNFSTYGASLVYVDEKGGPVAPLYNYLKSYPEALKSALYENYGGEEKLSCETASPVLGSLNSGMQLYRISKEKPELYARMKYALHLPQYISSLVTQKFYSDITSIGCHTQLWHFQQNKYHVWVEKEKIVEKLAPLFASDQTIRISFAAKEIEAGGGLHDSSAALIPYLTAFKEPFILISTGTWCISLNPFNDTPLTTLQLKQDCLCYLGYTGKAVKASRLFAGHEHEVQVKRIATHFNKPADFYKRVKYKPAMVATLEDWYDQHKNAGGFPKPLFREAALQSFHTYEEAYHALLFDIMKQQQYSTRLVIDGSAVKRIFVDGGFSKNSVYMHLLALHFPGMEVYAASVAQATAMGAALAIHSAWNEQPVPADMVKLEYYKISDQPDPVTGEFSSKYD